MVLSGQLARNVLNVQQGLKYFHYHNLKRFLSFLDQSQ
jgi:hypothetical protein